MLNQIIQGDCYELMKGIPDGSIDAIISDFPYNTTEAETDQEAFNPFLFWPEAQRVIKTGGVIVTTAAQPFSSLLVVSNLGWYKDEWIWKKSIPTGFLNAYIAPMREHEHILVFGQGTTTYNPQITKKQRSLIRAVGKNTRSTPTVYREGITNPARKISKEEAMPQTVLEFNTAYHEGNAGFHPTQKPIALYEYLIRTYSNLGEKILDPFVGGGTTALAAYNTGRDFIAFEKLPKYWQIANKRLALAQMQGRFEEMVG